MNNLKMISQSKDFRSIYRGVNQRKKLREILQSCPKNKKLTQYPMKISKVTRKKMRRNIIVKVQIKNLELSEKSGFRRVSRGPIKLILLMN